MKQEEIQYNLFKEEIKKYLFIYGYIPESEIMMLLLRYTAPIKKKMFIPYWNKNPSAEYDSKIRYYSFWIKRLFQEGIFIKQGNYYIKLRGVKNEYKQKLL